VNWLREEKEETIGEVANFGPEDPRLSRMLLSVSPSEADEDLRLLLGHPNGFMDLANLVSHFWFTVQLKIKY